MENNQLLKENVVCFDLKHGAIDAQETVNGGILLVVTGHLTLGTSTSTTNTRQSVHTFLLNNGAPPGRKCQFTLFPVFLFFYSPWVGRVLALLFPSPF